MKIKTHIIWFTFSVTLAVGVCFVTYNFMSEVMLATQISLYETENRLYDKLIEDVNRDNKESAVLILQAMRTEHSREINSMTQSLESGYFRGITRAWQNYLWSRSPQDSPKTTK
ncbi:MAG TPA: hypothetical protein VG962_03900 [Steroidobacteraceae bacterium]|nr:hypothetical protein [Steroidobacteraceae bacterium]